MAAGIGRAEGDLGQLAKMAYRPDAAQRWRRAKVLVIDEVSDFPYPLSPPPPALPSHTPLLRPQHDQYQSRINFTITTGCCGYCWYAPGLQSSSTPPCVFVLHLLAHSCTCRYITFVALKLLRGHANERCIFNKACRAVLVLVVFSHHRGTTSLWLQGPQKPILFPLWLFWRQKREVSHVPELG